MFFFTSAHYGTNMHIPRRYVPLSMTKQDQKRQLRELLRSRETYKRGRYHTRPKLASFRSRPSAHVRRAMAMYHVPTVAPTRALAKATGCSVNALRAIVRKGEGAYYSSGSRPNQTAQSWAYARLASAVTGGNASVVDYHILQQGCDPRRSRALKLARRQKTHKKHLKR